MREWKDDSYVSIAFNQSADPNERDGYRMPSNNSDTLTPNTFATSKRRS
jgi:hypothetical protein